MRPLCTDGTIWDFKSGTRSFSRGKMAGQLAQPRRARLSGWGAGVERNEPPDAFVSGGSQRLDPSHPDGLPGRKTPSCQAQPDHELVKGIQLSGGGYDRMMEAG